LELIVQDATALTLNVKQEVSRHFTELAGIELNDCSFIRSADQSKASWQLLYLSAGE
jgi:hypothetical protein